MHDCALLLLGKKNLLTKFQTLVQAGGPHGEGTHQEKQVHLAGEACLYMTGIE